MSRTPSRRELLQSLGLAAAWLPILSSTKASAAELQKPNVIFISWPNGCDRLWPTGSVSDFSFSTAEDSPGKPLNAWKDRLLVLGGLNNQALIQENKGGGHAAMPFLWTGVRGVEFAGAISDGLTKTAGGPSLDYWLASKIAAQEGVRPSERLLVQRPLRLNGDDIFSSFIGPPVGGKPNAVQPYDNPVELFDKLFAVSQQTAAEIALRRARKKSVLDVVGKQLERVCSRLGKDDRLKCEFHLASVREYEQLTQQLNSVCTAPALVPSRTADYLKESANPLVNEIHKLQAGMLVSALACGTARAASLQWCNSHNNQYQFVWLGDKDPAFKGASVDPGETGGGPSAYLQHHEIAHNDGRTPAHTRRKNLVDQWFMQNVADVLSALFNVKEPGGTLLDRTMVVVCNLQRTGGGHQLNDLPFFIAGNANNYFRTGRFYRWASGATNKELPINHALAEVSAAMGFPVDGWGDFKGTLPLLRA
jgi:Protein of unknown function (DUF1552)